MPRPIVIIFVLLSAVFAMAHVLAMTASLYWYYWWFDNMMHFWGGIMLGLGVHALTTFSWVKIKPTLKVLLAVLAVATIIWEIFERVSGLYTTVGYVVDTLTDIAMGFGGGLLLHIILNKYTIRT